MPYFPNVSEGILYPGSYTWQQSGRAKGPCHDCAEANLECDGQRPRCFVCMQNQIPCRGYKLELSWQSGVAARGNLRAFKYPVGQPTPQPSGATSQSSPLDKTISKTKNSPKGLFKFVTGRPAKRGKVREQAEQDRFSSHAPGQFCHLTPLHRASHLQGRPR